MPVGNAGLCPPKSATEKNHVHLQEYQGKKRNEVMRRGYDGEGFRVPALFHFGLFDGVFKPQGAASAGKSGIGG